jgi:hypothetical protein
MVTPLRQPLRVGIVGHEAAKFTPKTEEMARDVIRAIIKPAALVVSGHCHLGGIDIWAEEEAAKLGIPYLIFPPKTRTWTHYKERNLNIVAKSDIVHCVVVEKYPPDYAGMRFEYCYHCHTSDHIKSGGCWTAKRCPKRQWHII